MDVIGILAYGSLIEEPGQEILNLLVRRIYTTTPFPVEFVRKSRSRDNAPTLVPFEHGIPVNAQILVLKQETTFDQAANILYQRETRQTRRHYIRPSDSKITADTVLVDSLQGFEGVQTVLYTRIASNIENLTSNVIAKLAIESAKAKAGADRKDGISYLIAAKRNGIKTLLSGDYESEILNLTGTDDLESAYKFCRTNFVKLNISFYIPYLVKLVEGLDFPWDRINGLFEEELKQRKLKANGSTIKIDATIFDVIVEAKKGNSTAIGYLDFLNRVFKELLENLTLSERQFVQKNITDLLTKYDKGYWGYVAEIATLNNLIISKYYRLIGSEVRLPGTKPIDFQLHVIERNKSVFVEIVSVHLDSDRVNPDAEEMKKFIVGRVSEKIRKKSMDVEKYPNLFLVAVLWGDHVAVKHYSDFFKRNSLGMKNVIEPISYVTYSDGKGYYEHHFKTISNLFIEN